MQIKHIPLNSISRASEQTIYNSSVLPGGHIYGSCSINIPSNEESPLIPCPPSVSSHCSSGQHLIFDRIMCAANCRFHISASIENKNRLTVNWVDRFNQGILDTITILDDQSLLQAILPIRPPSMIALSTNIAAFWTLWLNIHKKKTTNVDEWDELVYQVISKAFQLSQGSSSSSYTLSTSLCSLDQKVIRPQIIRTETSTSFGMWLANSPKSTFGSIPQYPITENTNHFIPSSTRPISRPHSPYSSVCSSPSTISLVTNDNIASSLEKDKGVCVFYRKGTCKLGTECPFAHDIQLKIPICKFSRSKKGCKFGNKCRFYHPKNKNDLKLSDCDNHNQLNC